MPRKKPDPSKDGRRRPCPPHVKAAISKAHTGRKFSAETLARISAAAKERAKWCIPNGRLWTAEEDELVRALLPREVAAKTGRTLGSVKSRRITLGLPPLVPQWTAAQDRIVRNHPPAEAAALTGRTRAAVHYRRKALGLTRRRA
jgi:hypothetical protein